ncbi:hypothetical protein GGI15_004926 [Coemansia interrupta]|uniref:Uncharacterized protein n=1 Tax=Coemansia interrupta TaxID=1126814 RepID=A0A9W8H431_9FUNG|nr:hypothetical protein GGI15_004926 [Coemansia interrupta]
MRKDIEISAMHSRNGALLNEMAAQKDENVALVNRMAAQKDENVALLNEMVALKDDLDKANNVVSEVTEALQCPICLDTFTSPHVLRDQQPG